MKYIGPDFCNITSLLTDEELLIQKTANQFVAEEFNPIVNEYYEKGSFPLDLISKMGELGFFGATLPKKYGGSEITSTAYGLIMQELEKGDSGLRSVCSVQGSLVMFPIYQYGTDKQKDKWLPLLAAGKAVGCFGLTESNHGSDPAGMLTRAKRDGDDWIINGSKMWITNGSIADIAVVWARDEDDIIRGFLLEKGMDGFTSSNIHGKMSLRASITSELFMKDVRVSDANRLPNIEGLKGPLSCLTQARYSIAWGVIGAAIDCYEVALSYSKDRKQFSKPIAGFQLTQQKLVYMIEEITKAQLLALQLARLKDSGDLDFSHISLGKKNNVAIARKCAQLGREILGGNGIMDDYPMMRHMMNLETVYTYEGTHEIHTLILGQKITDIPAFE
ncbi:acyl-CoA dehydrogenase family protein [Candidatus Marinimicrobia bacterium]|jgi:glutaryl-CoA dehydrogenase|nr:acyl-CoA dehydrogenase family protein [Candidatus Neomarinimicrobiota bacterium]MDA9841326.1 acyl-CoA dehydrogenase family protein [Candidatus Neomarinimicrobiota bacterium]MDB3887898.1 acyl-CoA dehydrogenase family protein [Candidatus Neomarinimicrobiota bacterium]MDB3979845.1 acyl-CoA dehydrogenase family protein [Candidatus Neomarinimicrobiota bacterium]MDC0593903.1 acyl-CoA dehydrogenase family protein [Candidatus Neomarinimicrobiota bacterium]|tara:strand:+ start:8481 stop:9650 length:1170 start_codon:yes stop_codon:yes gene_type:complete